nr:hypothetical transcript [Hymenolepis microstoma]
MFNVIDEFDTYYAHQSTILSTSYVKKRNPRQIMRKYKEESHCYPFRLETCKKLGTCSQTQEATEYVQRITTKQFKTLLDNIKVANLDCIEKSESQPKVVIG